jgi:hypothetical protein
VKGALFSKEAMETRKEDGLNMAVVALRVVSAQAASGMSQTDPAASCGINLGNLNELAQGGALTR